MPRNSSGNYSLPAGNPVVPNTLIETTWANPTMSDIGASLTDSLDRYGRGGMLAQLKLADGTLVQPAFAFNSESSTGLLRPLAGTLQVAILGNLVAAFTASAVTFTQPPTYAANPVTGDQLTRKSYVDTLVTGSYLPLVGGALAGPGNLTVAGTLGVGGTPATKFHVQGASALAQVGATGDTSFHAFTVQDNAGGRLYLGIDNSAGSFFGVGAYGRTVYSEGAFPLLFNVNGSERIRISSAGDVGIGGTPARKLHTFGTVRQQNLVDGTDGFSFADAAGTQRGFFYCTPTYIELDSASAIPLIFGTNNTERARISATGLVLINRITDSGLGRVQVDGGLDVAPSAANATIYARAAATFGAIAEFSGNAVAAGSGLSVGHDSSGGYVIARASQSLRLGANSVVSATLDTNGNFGFGTSTPTNYAAYTTVEAKGKSGSGGGDFRVVSFDGLVSGEFYATGGAGITLGSLTAHPVDFVSSGVARMRIDATGNAAIGGTPTTNRLTVYGSAGQVTAAGVDAYFFAATTGIQNTVLGFNDTASTNANGVVTKTSYIGNLNAYPVAFLSNGSAQLTLDNSGNLLPISNNTRALGSASLRWSNVFAALGNFAPPAGTATVSILAIAAATANLEVSGNAVASGSGLGIQHDGTNAQLNLRTNGTFGINTNSTLRFQVTADGRVYGTALHNNAGAVTGTGTQFIASGTYTPTLTAGTNVSSVTNLGSLSGKWVRVGNVVRVVTRITVTPTAGAGATNFRVSLPIASNFTTGNDGTGTATILATPNIAGYVDTNSATDDVSVNFIATSVSAANGYIDFQYEVLP